MLKCTECANIERLSVRFGSTLICSVRGYAVHLVVDEPVFEAKSRLVLIALTSLTLRIMERWRHAIATVAGSMPDYENTMILNAIIVISAEKLIRGVSDPPFEALAVAFPYDRLTKCNVSSIAAITGLNRETVRRKVLLLESQQLVMKEKGGSVRIAHGILQLPIANAATRAELEVLSRAVNQLLAFKVLRPERRLAVPRSQS